MISKHFKTNIQSKCYRIWKIIDIPPVAGSNILAKQIERQFNIHKDKQRDKNMSTIRINIDKDTNTIKVFNNGRGIPVVEHKEEKVLVPTLIFGHLLTSSNYNDDEKKVTGKL